MASRKYAGKAWRSSANQSEKTSVFFRGFEYLELVPKAVAKAVKIPQRNLYGFFLVKIK